MAETLSTVIAKEIMSKLLSFPADEENLAWSFKNELKSLEETAEMVQALVFDDATNRKTQLDEFFGIWVRKLNDVAYDADAVLEEFTCETLRWTLENREMDKLHDLFSLSKNPLLFDLKMALKIRSINNSLDEIYKEGTKLRLIRPEGLKVATVELTEIWPTHPYLDDSDVVGMYFSDDVSQIVDMLCFSENERHLSFMAIVGKGGHGKIALAMLVFKRLQVKRHFDEIIWITVSEDFDVPRLLNEMVQSLTGKNPQLLNVDKIVKNELRGRLKGKKYLLVMV